MQIETRDLPVVVESIGRLAPNREVTLSAEVGGVIETYEVDVGDNVRAGQILLKIDSTDYLLALKEAEANLAVAQAQLDASKQTFERSKNLLPEKVITPDAFEKSEAAYKSASASVTRVKVLVDIASERLKKTRITAPFAGLIAARMVEKGQTVAPGQPLMTLADLNPIRVIVYLTAKDYVLLDGDDPVSVIIDSSPTTPLKGRIDRIGIKADERTNSFDVEILVDNPNLSLKAGMTARVRLIPVLIHDAILIPQSAVLYRKDREEVFVVSPDQKAEARQVELGRWQGAQVQIIKGLALGDKLIVTGGQYLESGDKVMISSLQQTIAP